jgi:flagellar biosynthetic protein FliR
VNWTAIFGIQLPTFLLALGRTSGIMITAPYFQSRSLPATVKAAMALLLAVVLSPVIVFPAKEWFQGNLWLIAVGGELLVGLTMGYILNLSFAGIQLAGQLIEVPMGFGVVNIIDPQTGGEMPIIGQLQHILVIWLFLLFQGDHLIIKALAHSYDLIPPTGFVITSMGVKGILQAFSGLFLLGLQIALPIMGVIFLTDLILGVVSRLIPQINVFMTGFPIKITLGLLLVALILPALSRLMANLTSMDGDLWQTLFRILGVMR